jgi:hypothetical protein
MGKRAVSFNDRMIPRKIALPWIERYEDEHVPATAGLVSGRSGEAELGHIGVLFGMALVIPFLGRILGRAKIVTPLQGLARFGR